VNEASQQQLAQQVHASGRRLVIAVTGGGSRAISSLLTTPGASRSILAATVPYSPAALVRWLGGPPDGFCSDRTGRAMAMRAFLEARGLEPAASVCGLACTASLASDRPKRGPHRAHVAWQSAATTATCSLEMQKGARTRGQEESLVAALVLNAAAEACGTSARLDLQLLAEERLETARVDAPTAQQDLLAGRAALVPCGAARADRLPQAVLAGAFNPLHAGHRQMAEAAAEILNCDVAFEISIHNVDKPPLDFIEIDRRLRQFAAAEAVWLTGVPTFVEKTALFPGATFVVGVDTMERIGAQRYYGSPPALATAIAEINARGCRFLVFGRTAAGRFRTLTDLQLPSELARLCQGVPEEAFRQDISSTELRRRAQSVAPDD
jgi:nicotinamide mononucleotide (NMN) deamidase PncC